MVTEDDIKEFYEHVNSLKMRFPGAAIAKATGESSGNVSKYLNGKLIPSESFLQRFYSCFPKSVTMVNEPDMAYGSWRNRNKSKQKEKANAIPFYDAQAVAGITETEMTPIHAPSGTIDIGDLLRDSQAAIRIYGNSMLPNYPPGCVVGLYKCVDSFIEPGEVYVIETRDRRMLKRLFFKDDDTNSDYFVCYSDNIMKFEGGARDGKLAYPPFELPKSEIVNMFIVTGVIKRNSNSVIINR